MKATLAGKKEESESIRRAVRENVIGAGQPGAVKKGAGLLTGLLRCRRCGRKLTVRYTGTQHEVLTLYLQPRMARSWRTPLHCLRRCPRGRHD